MMRDVELLEGKAINQEAAVAFTRIKDLELAHVQWIEAGWLLQVGQ